MDADIYGPNIPRMMGVNAPPPVENEKIIPLQAHGVKIMSLGFMIERDQPAIWRGPIIMKIITQFLRDVQWGELDYFLVDMPPGTGDAQLSLVQATMVHGAIIVTTPQEVAVGDALRGAKMFERVAVPVLGIVENMSWLECPHCGKPMALFRQGGGERLADRSRLPLLGQVPLYPAVMTGRRRRACRSSSPIRRRPPRHHIAVVDPGVGSSRTALAVESDGRLLVGPDNGVLSPALISPGARVVSLPIPPDAAPTFHGRDVFAPAAAALARGRSVDSLGTPFAGAIVRRTPEPRRLETGQIAGEVILIDRFGNAVTNLVGRRDIVVELGDRQLPLSGRMPMQTRRSSGARRIGGADRDRGARRERRRRAESQSRRSGADAPYLRDECQSRFESGNRPPVQRARSARRFASSTNHFRRDAATPGNRRRSLPGQIIARGRALRLDRALRAGP